MFLAGGWGPGQRLSRAEVCPTSKLQLVADLQLNGESLVSTASLAAGEAWVRQPGCHFQLCHIHVLLIQPKPGHTSAFCSTHLNSWAPDLQEHGTALLNTSQTEFYWEAVKQGGNSLGLPSAKAWKTHLVRLKSPHLLRQPTNSKQCMV